MARICVLQHNSNKDMRRISTKPWSVFFDTLTNSGNLIVGVEDSPDVIIHMNGHPKIIRKMQSQNRKVLNILILWESGVTRPSDSKEEKTKDYNYIFSPSPMWIKGKNVFYFNWPNGIVHTEQIEGDSAHRRLNRVIMLAGNKISFISGELYSLRRLYLKNNNEIIDVYGSGWNSNRHVLKSIFKALVKFLVSKTWSRPTLDVNAFLKANNYYGSVCDKSILLKYEFALVIENEATYVSEKLFDAIAFGCIPLYVGPNLEEFGIPMNVAFALNRDPKKSVDLSSLIHSKRKELLKIRDNGYHFLRSTDARKFENTLVLHNLATTISKLISLEKA